MSPTHAEPVLRPPRHLVSPRAVRYWTAKAALAWLLPLAGATAAALAGPVPGWVPAAVAVLAAAHLAVMPRWRYRVHRWEATPEAMYLQYGWFSQEQRIAPLSRIQTVDSHRGPLEALFDLANVTVTTASAAGPLRVHGLDRTEAQRLVDRLTEAAQRGEDDAT
ncbi:PH domain-containing protein [Kitasatospora sp. NPDC056446]|uniref:PH domain-containing protein n=1 Tax=Kitasatospora sp. NPDC056446 TaxID=3345819 RepID=UPI0036C81874